VVPLPAAAAVLAAGAVVAGIGGLLVFGTWLAVTYALRNRQRLRDRLTLGAAACGLILAGAVLSRYPWRSVDGYIGHSSWVQSLALVSLGALAASVVSASRPSPESGEGPTVSR
jgi:arabinofuranan 3-O-arabinosyltransferase